MMININIKDLYVVSPGMKLEDSPMYDMAKQFSEKTNIEYSTTSYYLFLKGLLLKLRNKYGDNACIWGYIYNEEDILKRCQTYHELYTDIKDNGLKNLINVWVGDNGEICTVDGSHRGAILFSLGIKKTRANVGKEGLNWPVDPSTLLPPYKIMGYTKTWIDFVNEARGIENTDLLYHPINHPWFDNWKVIRKCTDRLDMILKHVEESERIIDIGCHHGWFVHELTRRGFDIIGVDKRESSIVNARKLSKIYGLPDRFIQADIIDFDKKRVFDMVLLLGSEHHIEQGKGFEGLLNVFSIIGSISPRLIIEVATKDEVLNRGHKCNPETVEKIIESCTDYHSCGIIGTTENGRPLFLFERDVSL